MRTISLAGRSVLDFITKITCLNALRMLLKLIKVEAQVFVGGGKLILFGPVDGGKSHLF